MKSTDTVLKEFERNTWKLFTKHGARHPRTDVDILLLKWEKEGRGMTGVEDCTRSPGAVHITKRRTLIGGSA